MKVLCTGGDGKLFWATVAQQEAIEALKETQRGGCAAVRGYRPSTGYVESPVVDMQIITRFRTEALYRRKAEALANVTFSMIEEGIAADPVLSKMDRLDLISLFEERKSGAVASMKKTIDGDRDDAHREGHDRCYSQIGEGIKVHFITEKRADGLKHPILERGYPVVESVMLSYLELHRKERAPGVRKPPVNSKAPVRISNLIESQLNSRSVGFKTLSLKDGNFESLTISRKEFLPEDFTRFGDLLHG